MGGRLLDGQVDSNTVKGGCIFVDYATSYVHVEPMTDFTASDILRAKVNYEILMRTYGLIVTCRQWCFQLSLATTAPPEW